MSESKLSPLAERVCALLADHNLDQGRVDEIVNMVVDAEEHRDQEIARALSGEGLRELQRIRSGADRDEDPADPGSVRRRWASRLAPDYTWGSHTDDD